MLLLHRCQRTRRLSKTRPYLTAVFFAFSAQLAATERTFALESCPYWTSNGSFESRIAEVNRKGDRSRPPEDAKAAEIMKEEEQQFIRDNLDSKSPDDLEGDQVAVRLRERLANKLPQYAGELREMAREKLSDCIPGAAAVFGEADEKIRRNQQAQYVKQNPELMLLKAYHDYIGVRACQKARAGYEEVFVTDEEVADAKELAKAIEDAIRTKQPAIDKDKIWAQADSLKLAELVDKRQVEWMNKQAQDYLMFMRIAGAAVVEGGGYTKTGESFCNDLLSSLRSTADDLGIVQTHKKDF